MAATETTSLLLSTSCDSIGGFEKESCSDAKGDATPNRCRVRAITFLLLMTSMFERITYYSIVGNLVLFCTGELGYSSTEAVTISFSYTALAYSFPPLGGRIADAVSNRFNTIFGSFLIYFVGIALLPVVAFDYFASFGYDSNGMQYGLPLNYKRGYYLFGLLLTSAGAGCIKANITPHGAAEVKSLGGNAVHSFFNWYYWCLNVGGMISYLGIAYVQQEINFFIGYLIPVACLLLALVLFFIPRNVYSEQKRGSVAGEVVGILWQGLLCRLCGSKEKKSKLSSCLDGAKISNGGRYGDAEVNNLKCVIKVIPIFATLVLFATFSSQCTATMLLQGERMSARFGDFVFPVASLNAFKMAAVAALVPALDLVIYPLLNHYRMKPSLLQRIGLGLSLSVVSLVYMGILEIVRKNDLETNGGTLQQIGSIAYNASSISILWQVPQFLIVGVAESFASMTAMEFSYAESPAAMQGLVMGLNHWTTCLGNIVGTALYNVIAFTTENSDKPWLPNEINNGYLEYFIFLLAGILLLNFVVFVVISRKYQYQRSRNHSTSNPDSLLDNQPLSAAEETHN